MSDSKALAGALADRLALHRVGDQAISRLVRDIGPIGHHPIDVDVCTLGICVDYYIPRSALTDLLDALRKNTTLGPIRVFPKGILPPENFLVQVEHALDRNA